MEFYSVLKVNEVPIDAIAWMNLENILSEISQACGYIHMRYLEESSLQRQKIEWWLLGTE